MHRLARRGEQAEQAEQEFQTARVHLEEALKANPEDARLVLALGENQALVFTGFFVFLLRIL